MKKGDKYNIFLKWLKDNGAKGESLYFKEYSDTMRGVVSAENISSQSLVMKIPIKLLIHSNLPRISSDTVKKLIEYETVFFSKKHVYLSIYIAETINSPGHFFQPYYKILPKNLNNIPLFWTSKELSILKGSNVIKYIKDKINDINEEYNSIVRNVDSFKDICSSDRYKYIRCLVASRNFTINIDGQPVISMVPWADMLNHDIPSLTSWGYSNNENGYFYVKAKRDINKGLSITDSYGLKPNKNYFLHYGFTIRNPSKHKPDTINVKINSHKITLSMPFDIKVVLKTEIIKKETLFKINKELISILDNYPTTYKEDIKLLKRADIKEYSNRYNALVIISGEKKIIHEYIENIFSIIDTL